MKTYLSPSEVHGRMLAQVTPSLAFDGGDVRAWQRKLRRKLKRLMGDMPEERVPLRPRTLWRREHCLGTIEKVVFRSEPHADVTAYVCLPKGVEPPYDTFICLQGHSTGMHNSIAVSPDESKEIDIAGDRDFGLGCMARGLAAICIEQRSFGERGERKQAQVSRSNPCHDAAWHSIMLGRTLIGERVWDVDRTIDYLATRGDANMARIGVMGNSGGGTISLFSAAVLPRISVAMPSCYFCTFRHSIMSIYHCGCNYVPGLIQVAEMSDIMGLFAPKPVVLVAGREDPIFPIRAVRKSFRDLQKIYAAAGAPDNCRLVVGPEGHRFYADLAWPKMRALMG